MKKMKKSVSIIIVIALIAAVLTAAPITAFAARNYLVVDENIQHGTVTVTNPSNLNNKVNDLQRVDMTVTPDEGYALKNWNVHFMNGENIEVQTGSADEGWYYFIMPQGSASATRYVVISTVFETNVPNRVSVSFSDFTGRGSSISIDRQDGLYLKGETVTVSVNIAYGAQFYAGGLSNSYYYDNGQYVYFEDFENFKKIDDTSYSFTMPDKDVNLICFFDYCKAQLGTEKFFIDTDISSEDAENCPSIDPITYKLNEDTGQWDYADVPNEFYTNEKIRFVTKCPDSDDYCITGMTAVYEKDGKTVEEDIVDYDEGFGESREIKGTVTMPGSDVTVRFKLEKLYFVYGDSSYLGNVTPNISRALPGDKVKLNIETNLNIGVSQIVVKDEYDNVLTLGNDNTFTMPDCNVTIKATYNTSYVEKSRDGDKVVGKTKGIPADKMKAITSISNNTLENGYFYVVSGTTDFNSRLVVSGTSNIVLCDGAVLNANKGIQVSSSAKLNIYAQQEGSGKINATTEHNTSHAVIGADYGNSGEINIHGGVFDLNTNYHSRGAALGGGENGAAGKITIYDGNFKLRGDGGAGIGGGNNGQACCVNGEGIVIYGGTIETSSTGGGAGIGGGYNCNCTTGSIAIYGGHINAEGWGSSAGIGGGYASKNNKIDIYGGEIIAVATGSDNCGAGIGSGKGDQGSSVNIHGGAVVAYSKSGAGIGAGRGGNAGVVNVDGGALWAHSSEGGAGIGGGNEGNGGTVNISRGVVIATSALYEYSPGAFDAIVNAIEGIEVVDGNEYGAAIGASIMFAAGIIIDLIGSSDKSGAGIGGGDDAGGGTVNITGGVVIAQSSLQNASAIGHGNENSNNGKLYLYDTAMVKAGSNEDIQNNTLQLKSNRINACHNNKYVLIEPCSYHSYSFVDKGDEGHCFECDYCYAQNLPASAHLYLKNGQCLYCHHQSFLLNVTKVWPQGVSHPNKVTLNVKSVYKDGSLVETDTMTYTLNAQNNWTAQVPAIPGNHKLIFTESEVNRFLPDAWTLDDGNKQSVLPYDSSSGVFSGVLDLTDIENKNYDDYVDILSSENRTIYLTTQKAYRMSVKLDLGENVPFSISPEGVDVDYSLALQTGTVSLNRSNSYTSHIQIPANSDGVLSFTSDDIEYFTPIMWTLSGSGQSVAVSDENNKKSAVIAINDTIKSILEADNTQVTYFLADSSTYPETADYSEVLAAISLANSMSPAEYYDFSGITNAIDDVVFGLSPEYQTDVDLMAQKINEEISSLESVTKYFKLTNAVAQVNGNTINISIADVENQSGPGLQSKLTDGSQIVFSELTGAAKVSKYGTLYGRNYGTAKAYLNGTEYNVYINKPEYSPSSLFKLLRYSADTDMTVVGTTITLTPKNNSSMVCLYPSLNNGDKIEFTELSENAKLSKNGTLYAHNYATAKMTIFGIDFDVVLNLPKQDEISKIIRTSNADVSVEGNTVTLTAVDKNASVNLYSTAKGGKQIEFSDLNTVRISKNGTCYAKTNGSCKINVDGKTYDVIFVF